MKIKYIGFGLLIIIFSVFLYVQFNKLIYVNKVADYLHEEKGYSNNEISSIKGIWGKKLPSFYVEVVFKNEQNIVYTYFAHNDIIQFDYQSTDGTTISKDSLKNYDPN